MWKQIMSKQPTYKEILLLLGSSIAVSVCVSWFLVNQTTSQLYRELDRIHDKILLLETTQETPVLPPTPDGEP